MSHSNLLSQEYTLLNLDSITLYSVEGDRIISNLDIRRRVYLNALLSPVAFLFLSYILFCSYTGSDPYFYTFPFP